MFEDGKKLFKRGSSSVSKDLGAPETVDKKTVMLTVQIPKSEIYGTTSEENSNDPGPITGQDERRASLKNPFSRSDKKEKTVPIRMTQAEFMAYFVKDEKTGKYKDNVVEPPGGRQQWLQQRTPDKDPEQWDLMNRENRRLAQTKGADMATLVTYGQM